MKITPEQRANLRKLPEHLKPCGCGGSGGKNVYDEHGQLRYRGDCIACHGAGYVLKWSDMREILSAVRNSLIPLLDALDELERENARLKKCADDLNRMYDAAMQSSGPLADEIESIFNEG
jgi:hypothetical protein